MTTLIRTTHKTKERNVVSKRTTVVLVPTRYLSWDVENVVSKRTTVVLVPNANAGGSGKGSKDQSQDQDQNLVHVWNRFVKYSVSLISEVFYVQVDAIAWWIDSGAITHVCKDRCWFKTYEPVEDGSVLYMGDGHSLMFMEKECGYKQVYESDKYILSKSGVFVGFDYYNNGIIHETTAPYTPHQNGVAKRKNKALKEMVNSMLSYLSFSEGFWGEAMAVVRLPDLKRKALCEKGIDCNFVGYAEHSKAYRFYVIEPNYFVFINSIIESRDAIFDENRFSSIPRPKDIIPNFDESQRDDHSNDVPSETPKPHRGKRARKAKSYGSDIEEDPRTYNKAMQSRDVTLWKEVINDEIGSIMENNIWVLSDLPPGFRQKEGIDYFDTYALVARIITFRLLLALVAIHNLVIHQMDVKTTFLNGDLEEEVYMKQLEGFVMLGNDHKIEKILKKFNREDCSPVSTPMNLVEKLKLNTGKPVDQLEYSRAIGCLMYAMTSTRPDIAYAVGRLSRFTSKPGRQHWYAITRVFKYLKGTMDYGLSYVGYPLVLEAYSDASWINHVEDSSFTSGWVFMLGGALAAAGKEAKWLRNLIHENPIWPKPIASISIQCDSGATLAKAYSQIYNGKSRHLADHLTKGLARDLVIKSVTSDGIKLDIGTRVFVFPRCNTKRTTYVNMKFCRFKKLGLGFIYVH
ncbi:zinc finger, CCHC-type containing protein [Tanacetum coccineum]